MALYITFLDHITILEEERHGVFGSPQNLFLAVPIGHEQAGRFKLEAVNYRKTYERDQP